MTDKFKFIKVLGKGAFAKVHLAIKGHNQDKKYAVKSIKKKKVLESNTGKEDIKREVRILRKLYLCGNIINIVAVYDSDKYVHMILEY